MVGGDDVQMKVNETIMIGNWLSLQYYGHDYISGLKYLGKSS